MAGPPTGLSIPGTPGLSSVIPQRSSGSGAPVSGTLSTQAVTLSVFLIKKRSRLSRVGVSPSSHAHGPPMTLGLVTVSVVTRDVRVYRFGVVSWAAVIWKIAAPVRVPRESMIASHCGGPPAVGVRPGYEASRLTSELP